MSLRSLWNRIFKSNQKDENKEKPLYIRVLELNKRVVKSDHIKFCVRIDDLLHLSDDKYIDYYKNMSDEDLLKVINKGIKKYKVDMKKKDLENDFQGF